MRSHKAKNIVQTLDTYLPKQYIQEVIKRCEAKDLKVKSQYVRDVKRFQRRDPAVLGIILEIAIEIKEAQKKLEEFAKH